MFGVIVDSPNIIKKGKQESIFGKQTLLIRQIIKHNGLIWLIIYALGKLQNVIKHDNRVHVKYVGSCK